MALLEEWLTFWTAIVVLGLLYEYGYELLEAPHGWRSDKPWPFRHAVRLTKLGAIFVTVGVAGELYVGVVASPAQEALRQFNKTQTLRLEKEAESERLARVRLEEDLGWRRLSTDQQVTLAASLLRFTGKPAVIEYNEGDLEGKTFATDVFATLRLSKWPLSPRLQPKIGTESGELETGVVIQTTPDKNTWEYATRLSIALLKLGFDARVRPMGRSGRVTIARAAQPGVDFAETYDPGAALIVVVEFRPPGPQGEAKLRAERSKEK